MFGIVGAVVTVGSAAVGAYSANESNKTAQAGQKEASRLGDAQMSFSREQYDDWQRVYGPIQDRLSNYYKSLDPGDFAAQGVNQLSQQYQQVVAEFDRDIARRGIDAPASSSMKAQLDLDFARNKAEIRQQAPMQVAQAQQGFLSSNTMNPGAPGVMNAMGNQQQMYTNQANQASQQSMQAGQAVGQTLTSALTSYYSNKSYNERTAQLAGGTE